MIKLNTELGDNALKLYECFSQHSHSKSQGASNLVMRSSDDIWGMSALQFRSIGIPRCFANLPIGHAYERRASYPIIAWPNQRADLVTIEDSVELMSQAELHALEFISELLPFGASPPTSVQWCFVEKLPLQIVYLGAPFDFAIDLIFQSLEHSGKLDCNESGSEFFIPKKAVPPLFRKVVQSHAAWRWASENHFVASEPEYALPYGKKGTLFSDLTSPFESLMDLYRCGCFISDIPVASDATLKLLRLRGVC